MSSELHQGACACEGRRARRWASRTDGLPASSIDGTVCCLTRGWGGGHRCVLTVFERRSGHQ